MSMIDSKGGDYTTVRKAVSSRGIGAIQTKIIEGIATDKEIEQHYRTFDAINAPVTLKNERALYVQMRNIGRVSLADFIGGAQMMSGVLFGDALNRNGGYDGILSSAITTDDIELIQGRHAQGSLRSTDIDRWDTTADYVDYSHDNPVIMTLAERVGLLQAARLIGAFDNDTTVTSTDKLRSISLARVIMGEGTRVFRHYIDYQPNEFIHTQEDVSVANTLIDIAEDSNVQMGLSNLILRSGNYQETVEAKEIFLTEIKRTFGPMLSWETAGQKQHYIKHQGVNYAMDVSSMWGLQEESFIDALGNMRALIEFAKNTDPDMFKKGRIKGELHEALWILDAFVLRKGMRERYGSYGVNVATEAEDMPFLNRPNMKRGYDFIIIQNGDVESRRLIQVGASTRKVNNKSEQPYHPNIEVYCERAFNDVNVTTLEKKISMYKKWAENGFSEQDFIGLKIQDILLGTVKEAFRMDGEQ